VKNMIRKGATASAPVALEADESYPKRDFLQPLTVAHPRAVCIVRFVPRGRLLHGRGEGGWHVQHAMTEYLAIA